MSQSKVGAAPYDWWFTAGLHLSGEEMSTEATLKWGPPSESTWWCSVYVPGTCAQHVWDNTIPDAHIYMQPHKQHPSWTNHIKHGSYSEVDKRNTAAMCGINKGLFKWNKTHHNDLRHTSNINSYKSHKFSPQKENSTRLTSALWKPTRLNYISEQDWYWVRL